MSKTGCLLYDSIIRFSAVHYQTSCVFINATFPAHEMNVHTEARRMRMHVCVYEHALINRLSHSTVAMLCYSG